MRRLAPRLWAVLLVVAVAGCGGAAPTAGIGTSHAARAARPIDMELVLSDGRWLSLADQRGGVVLLFITSTYDGVCQAAIRPVSMFTVGHLDTVVLAIVAQPDGETFAALYDETFDPPYSVAWEPGDSITLGTSGLGELEAVPTFVMLDAHGMVVDHHVGWITDERLEEMYHRAVERGGITIVESPSGETPEGAADPDAEPPGDATPEGPADPDAEPPGAAAGDGPDPSSTIGPTAD